MQIIKHSNIYFAISGVLVGASVLAVAVFGLRLGIDFTGGSLLEITVDERIEADAASIAEILTRPDENGTKLIDSVQVQKTGEHGFLLRFRDISEEEHQAIAGRLNTEFAGQLPESERSKEAAKPESAPAGVPKIQATDSQGNPVDIQVEGDGGAVISSPVTTIGGLVLVSEDRFESIGPTIGQELKQKSAYAIIAVIISIILYIAWAFRKVSKPVSSWKYGITAIIALIHDVAIPTGIFAVLGKLAGVEVDILFVTALLTILGYSVNDTIVVFDRTRENLSRDHWKHEFEWIVNTSVNETVRRSVFTALTTFVVLLAVYLFGGESIKNFVLALMIGVVAGTYSSIFLASPLLVAWEKRSRK
ncbi:MAG: protein translocase subunit SecF [Parcubacteria group bacterium]|nr:protein translocase subunit SecF [Parcubacteria group bacterium]